VGQNASADNNAGDGGNGLAVSITGTSVFYAGGGGGCAQFAKTVGIGGLGGGGDGSSTGGVPGQSGTANTGGGGGGHRYDGNLGGAGGSGVVILRYPIGLA
jgi:hypothetical protein